MPSPAAGGTNQTPGTATAPGTATGTSQGLHPIQRDSPVDAASQPERTDTQLLGSGGKPSGESAGGAATDDTPAAGGSLLALTDEEKEKIRRVIRSYSIAPSDDVKIPLRLGEIVPADVPLKPLPPEVASVVPNYKNYSYVMNENQIAIVITEKREIDVVIPG